MEFAIILMTILVVEFSHTHQDVVDLKQDMKIVKQQVIEQKVDLKIHELKEQNDVKRVR